MKLDDFLGVKQVRCIRKDCPTLTAGKTYAVLSVTSSGIKTLDDENEEWWSPFFCFEPVIESSEKLPQVAGSKFKAGEKVYFSTDPDVKTISEVSNDNTVRFMGESDWVSGDCCCPATQENYEKLCSLFECIDFEQPPKPLTGNELCRKLLDKGEKYIMAKDDTDTWRIICDYCDDWFTDVVTGKCLKNVTPVNSKGEPLTESILND